MNTRKMAILSMLTALAVVGRIGFTFIPNVQPMTAIILITALLLGRTSGVMVAVMAAILSNLLLGIGLWTISQVICWGFIALFAGFIGHYQNTKYFLFVGVLFAVFSGYLYGFFISLPMFAMTDYGWVYYLAGLPFDTAHAVGNGVFFILLYPVLRNIFHRFMPAFFKSNGRDT